jgi:predicted ArsR family transcriptional regulator
LTYCSNSIILQAMAHSDRTSSTPNEATRGRLLAFLRETPATVDDLAVRLALTDNAVRFHLASLERLGTVRKEGVRRAQGAGKPADLYALTPAAEESFSQAYAPVLVACVEELNETMSSQQVVAFLKRVGKRLAKTMGNTSGSLHKRVGEASRVLNSLGAITVVEKRGETYSIVGRACPLSRAVECDPCVCSAVTTLVAEVVGTDVTERCDHSGRPKCHFEISGPSQRAG